MGTINNRTTSSVRKAQRRDTGRRTAATVSATQLTLLAQLKTGTIVGGNFKIIAIIGDGGMGIVFSAEHIGMKRKCALKVLACDIDENWSRFQAEAKLLSKLSHATLVQVYDLGVHQKNLPYYAMDYLDGSTLEELLCSKGPLSLDYVIDIFLSVLDGLAYAHSNGVIHRDIKPANIFICSSDKLDVKILDFGISKLTTVEQSLTRVGEIFGSPYYMSPEQCRGGNVDARSDIYSVGCSLFESLTGYVPYEGEPMEMVMLHEQGEIPCVNDFLASDDAAMLPAAVDVVIANCLAKLPEERYQSAQGLKEDLLRLRSGAKILALKPEHKPATRPNLLIMTAGLIVIAFGLGLFVFAPNTPFQVRATFSNVSSNPSPKALPSPSRVATKAKLADRMVTSLYSEALPTTLTDGRVESYLATHPRPYSNIDSVGKQFDFPATFSLGQLIVSGPGQLSQKITATGKVKLIKGQLLRLRVSPEVCLHARLLNLFRPDDLNSIYIDPGSRDPAFFNAIASLSGLTHIEVNRASVTSDELNCLNRLPHLRTCDLRYCGIDGALLAKQKFLGNIISLRFEGAKVVTPVIRRLSRINKIDNLTFGGCQITDEDIAGMVRLTNLDELSLLNTSIANEQLAKLVVLQKIKRLNLDLCSKLDQASILTLAQFKNLEVVTVPDALLTDSNETLLTNRLPRLKSFR